MILILLAAIFIIGFFGGYMVCNEIHKDKITKLKESKERKTG